MNLTLRDLLKPEYVLLGIVVIVAVVGAYLFNDKRSAEDEQVGLENDLNRVRQQLRNLDEGGELETLQAELAAFQDSPIVDPFPTRSEALDVYSSLSNGFENLSVDVSRFSSSEVFRSLEQLKGETRPTVTYSLVAKGREDDLLGILALLDEIPTGIVQKLDLTAEKSRWLLNLELAVFYAMEPVEISEEDESGT